MSDKQRRRFGRSEIVMARISDHEFVFADSAERPYTREWRSHDEAAVFKGFVRAYSDVLMRYASLPSAKNRSGRMSVKSSRAD